MWDLLLDVTVPAIVAGGGAIAIWASLERLYVPVPPNRALVLFGRRARPSEEASGGTGRAPQILVGGGALVAPWNRATAFLSLAPIDVEATVRAVHALDAGSADGWEVTLQVQAKIPAEPRALRSAAENLLGLAEEELKAFVRRAVEGAVPSVLARIRRGDAEPDWERLGAEIQAAVAPELVPAGLVVRSIAVKELRRLGPPARADRPADPRRRTPWTAAEATARREESDLRLNRVEHGLRAIAADLARLLRDEPPRPESPERAARDERVAPRLSDHDSTADGRRPAPERLPWGAEPETEASP